MTNLDHGKFSRVTTIFHSLLALTVFFLFFTGYSIAFNAELWWLVELMGGNEWVLTIHRVAGFTLMLLTVFWVLYMLLRPSSRSNLGDVIPDIKQDTAAFVQDVKFALGYAEERHPHAKQFAGYKADEVPLLSYVGKGVIAIFAVELVLLMISGLLIWQKTWLMDFYNTQSVAMGFVAFHGLLGIIMFMGVMFHTFEHACHPAFYPVEMKAFLPKEETPNFHGDADDYDTTGIENLRLKPTWKWATNLFGAMVIIGIAGVLAGSMTYGGYPIPDSLAFNEGNIFRTIAINVGVLVLFVGLALSMYGNILRVRYQRQREAQAQSDREQDRTDDADAIAADGGETR
ncbi:cytochrome b/b6 domain-containing protein [Halopiger thermotolerans]